MPTSHNVKAISLLCSHKFEEALQASQLAIDLDANSFLSYRNMGVSQLGLQQYPEAIEALETAAKLSNRHPWALADLSMVHAMAGGEEEPKKIFEELVTRSEKEFISGMNLFIAGYFSKNHDRAFEFLEQAFEQRDSVLVISKVWPFFAVLRKDPRFQSFIQKMNFPGQ